MYTYELMMQWENSELTEDETIQLFAELVANGSAWHLQGMYGRKAAELIEAGYISRDGKILQLVED
jgi:hypothetical protein